MAIVRLEISINNKFIKSTVEAITKVVKKEGIRDAEIFFILPIEECIRIWTGETDKGMIGCVLNIL